MSIRMRGEPGGFCIPPLTDLHIQPALHAADGCYPRAKPLFDLYQETLKLFRMPVHAVLGNYDVFGVSSKSGVALRPAGFDRRQIGPRFRRIHRRGQIDWLRADLARMARGTPLVVVTRVPLVSAVLQTVADPWKTPEPYLVTNAREVLDVLWPYGSKWCCGGTRIFGRTSSTTAVNS